jgi:YidC/Oxa1 family membrane protein insertase
MKKNDFIIVGVLVALMFAWMNFYPVLERKFFPRPAVPEEQVAPVTAETAAVIEQAEQTPAAIQKAVEKAPEAELPSAPEQFEKISNDDIELTVSSWGGAIVSAELKNYPAENRKNSGPVVLEFTNAPALRYDGIPAGGVLEKTEDGLLYTAALGDGRFLKRTFSLDGEYLLTVEDSFINSGSAPWALPALRLPSGPMSNPSGTGAMKGIQTLGVDTFSVSGRAHHWGGNISEKLFADVQTVGSLKDVPEQIDICPSDIAKAKRGFWDVVLRRTLFQDLAGHSVNWVASKNKFFVQLLAVKDGEGIPRIIAKRSTLNGRPSLDFVAAALQFDKELIAPGETFGRSLSMYIGPKDYSFLRTQDMDQVEVMEFRSTGFWKFMNPVMYPIKVALLWSLNALHAVVRNYGVAIMLLTIIVRVLFWPITHKGTESMRRMQALQPQLKAIQQKYKDNPKRMQQETMQFYRDNKVNPMGGCLPMFVQIPVFIALYVVLHSAIQLRFSKFLWIKDLSEPENLFAGMIPFIGSLNILPLLMSATMYFQQKVTPTAAATPEQQQQQKMMAVMMPVMMLFFFYTMPSGLVLYWTTSNLIMIFQMMIKRQKPVA